MGEINPPGPADYVNHAARKVQKEQIQLKQKIVRLESRVSFLENALAKLMEADR